MPSEARKVYIRAAGGLMGDGVPIGAAHENRTADAQPVDLRALGKSLNVALPRLASRLAQLAVIGARLCADRLSRAPAADSPVYLASGLGDVAHTDALYYQVMPPRREMASPAQFATSGNNMAAFFVAQQLALTSRNFTVSQGDLSLEYALMLALDDMCAGGAKEVLVGAVDETTLPREFYVRRYPPSEHAPIGEGSAWLALGLDPAAAIGELLDVAWLPPAAEETLERWADRIAGMACRTDSNAALTLMPGTRLSPAQIAALRARLNIAAVEHYQAWTGAFPTAAAVAMVHTLREARAHACTYLHVNIDARGAGAVCLWRKMPNKNSE